MLREVGSDLFVSVTVSFYILKIHGEKSFKLIQYVPAQGNINNQYIISKSGEFLCRGLGYIVCGDSKKKIELCIDAFRNII